MGELGCIDINQKKRSFGIRFVRCQQNSPEKV